jgi:predicted metal-dependent RNase
MNFVDGIALKPQQIRIVHGEEAAKLELRSKLQAKGLNAVVARNDE